MNVHVNVGIVPVAVTNRLTSPRTQTLAESN